MRDGRPVPVPVPRLDLRPRGQARPGQAHRRPRRLQPRDVRAHPGRLRDLAGVRLPEPGSGRGAPRGPARRPRRAPRAVRLRGPPAGPDDDLRRRANWKFIAENYSECYHCPPLHPQLNKLTPYDVGGDYDPDGAWQGGWMELVAGRRDDGARWRTGLAPRPPRDVRDDGGRRAEDLLLRRLADRCSCRSTPTTCSSTGSCRSPPDRTTVDLPAAVRARDDGPAGLRPVRRDRLLGPDEHPGLARLRAAAAGDPLALVGQRPLLEPGGVGPRVRPDGRRPLRGRAVHARPDGPRALRRAAAEGGTGPTR